MSYLLDTDTLSNPLKKRPSSSLLRRLAEVPTAQQFTSTITIGEMVYGAHRSAKRETFIQHLYEDILPNVHVLPFDLDAAFVFGRLRAELEALGTPLDLADLRIASIALSKGLVLVTGNVRHFERVPDLTIENWLVD